MTFKPCAVFFMIVGRESYLKYFQLTLNIFLEKIQSQYPLHANN